MAENKKDRYETRSQRHQKDPGKLDKAYYYIVAILMIILIILVGYIFLSRRGDGLVELEEPLETKVSTNQDNQKETETSTNTSDTNRQKSDQLDDEISVPGTNYQVKIQENAPVDETYYPVFEAGSPDMEAVMIGAMAVTGLSKDNINAIWIGGNGPGRIEATVANGDYTEEYVVNLVYSDQVWYVTDYIQTK